MIDGLYEFTYKPPQKRQRAVTVMMAILGAAALLVAASVISPKYKGLISLVAVGLLCASIYVFTRYVSGVYAYVVKYDYSGSPLFLITKTVGKRVSTLAEFPLKTLIGAERSKMSSDKTVRRYNFAQNMNATELQLLKFSHMGMRAEVQIEGTDILAERLIAYAALAREFDNEE